MGDDRRHVRKRDRHEAVTVVIAGRVDVAAARVVPLDVAVDPVAGRVMGSLFLGFGFGSLFAYRASSWEEVRILVLADLIWCVLCTIAMVWMMLVYPTLPVSGWLEGALVAFFAVLFAYAYFTTNE